MGHFSDEAWVDFVRQVTESEQIASMREHLDTGCAECREAHGTWQTAAQVIGRQERFRREEQFQCPENTVRSSQAAYTEWRWRNVILPRARIARLIFDNLLDPVPAGARANAAPARRVLHRVGPWAIDFRLETEAGNLNSLVGQVQRSGKRYSGASGIEILLMSAETVVAKTNANEFGEFQLQFQSARNLRMYFEIPGHEPIAVDLPNPEEGTLPYSDGGSSRS